MSLFRGSVTRQTSDLGPTNRPGGIVLMVALFMPIAMLSVGMVSDIGLVFIARKAVQDACDLGTLAGCQELDWDLLAEGIVAIKRQAGSATAIDIAKANLEGSMGFLKDLRLKARVINELGVEPKIALEANFTVDTIFLRWLPRYRNGITIHVYSESSVVERTQW